jgi:hypothetical protein
MSWKFVNKQVEKLPEAMHIAAARKIFMLHSNARTSNRLTVTPKYSNNTLGLETTCMY